MGTPLTFKVYRGDELLRTEQFARDVIKIGNLSSAHLRLEGEEVSRVHAVIEVAPDGRVSVIDMSGAAGTFLNGRKVRRAAMHEGDELGIGALRVVLAGEQRGEEPPAQEPPRPKEPPVEDPRPDPKPVREPGKPKPPIEAEGDVAVAALAGDGDLGAELRLFWADTLIEARTFVRPPRPVLIGARDDCALHVASPELGEEPIELLRYAGGEYQVTSPRDGREHGLSPGMAVRVELGARLAIVARLRTPPPPAQVPWWERSNWRFANVVLLLAFVGGLFVIGAAGVHTGALTADAVPPADPVRLTRFVAPPPPRARERLARGEVPRADDQKPGESGEKHRGTEGKMGRRDAPRVQARSAPKAVDRDDREIVKQAGLLAVLDGGKGAPAGLSTVLGRGGLGGDLKGAVGNMFGATVGDAFGFGGLGLKGEGQGGGGSGQTIGIGAVGTKGRGGGMGGYGSGVGGLGKKGEGQIGIATAEAKVLGAIDPELIRRVIREHASQVRYCYEQQLALDPKLEGKVAIRWQIEADGRATSPQVEVAETTLRSVEVQRCIMSRIVTWPFPKPRGGGIAIVKYPWILRTSGSAG